MPDDTAAQTPALTLTLAPYPVAAPPGSRPAGTAPFWTSGTEIMWRFRDHGWGVGDAETAIPTRVVRDDEQGLMAWLAPGPDCCQSATPTQRPARHADGPALSA